MSISPICPGTGQIAIHYFLSFRRAIQLTEEVQPTFVMSKSSFSDAILIPSTVL
jgi:hypothetical protein